VNFYVVFSTSPGEVALGGAGENSPFASAFLQAASQDAVPLSNIFKQGRRQVFVETRGVQVPWDSSTMLEEATISRLSAVTDAVAPTAEEGTTIARRLTLFASSAELLQVETVLPTPDISIDAPLAPAVPIWAILAKDLDLGPTDMVGLAAAPRRGRLVLLDDQGLSSAPVFPLSTADLGRLVFAYVGRAVVQFGQDPLLKVQFKLEQGGIPKIVHIDLTPDPCDLAAADHLDPEGVGLVRFANAIEPEAALQACQDAVQREPQNGRFHYQLGRALNALRRTDEARAAWDTARTFGHSRASYAIGNLIVNQARETGGSAVEVAPDEALAFFREGAELGDPYAFYALGRQMVRFGDTGQERLRGYDLLMRALAVGHAYAMNELGYFYLDAESEYYDPARGLRDLNESAARGDTYGYNNLGLAYMNGLCGQAKDANVACSWFTQASDGGHPNAPGNIAQLIASGALGKNADLGKAV
jgi:TPR repeat protein